MRHKRGLLYLFISLFLLLIQALINQPTNISGFCCPIITTIFASFQDMLKLLLEARAAANGERGPLEAPSSGALKAIHWKGVIIVVNMGQPWLIVVNSG